MLACYPIRRDLLASGLDRSTALQESLHLADKGRVYVKVSGYAKFSAEAYPFEDCWPFVRAAVDAFTLDSCLWASDGPFLRSTQSQDYGPLVGLARRLFPNTSDRRRFFWDTSSRLFELAPWRCFELVGAPERASRVGPGAPAAVAVLS